MEVTTQKSMSSAQLRKIKKPIIERRRRERINDSLNQLKSLLLEAMDKDESRHSKMEKADILELAVDYLKTTQSNNMLVPAPTASDEVTFTKYNSGYKACAEEVGRYFNKVQGLSPQVTNRLAGHLTSCIRVQPQQPVTSFQGQQFPESTPVSSLPGSTTPQTALPLYITTTGQMYGLHVLSPTPLAVCPQNELVNGLISPEPSRDVQQISPVVAEKPSVDTNDIPEFKLEDSHVAWRPW